MMSEDHAKDNESQRRHPRWWHVAGSVLAAGFGVQSSKNRERDFKHGRATVFLGVGLVFTLLLLGILYAIVHVVVKSAAG